MISSSHIEGHHSNPLDISVFQVQKTSNILFQKFLEKQYVTPEIRIINKIGKYNLAWPIILTITYENDLIFIESETPNLWGEGESIEDAIRSYENFFLYDFESYKNTPKEKLDYFAQQELNLYRALLNIS